MLAIHVLLRQLDGLYDVLVAGAAAQVAFETGADLRLTGLRLVLEDLHRGHHHARRAEAALQAVMLAEGFLHRMQLVAIGKPLDRQHVRAFAR